MIENLRRRIEAQKLGATSVPRSCVEIAKYSGAVRTQRVYSDRAQEIYHILTRARQRVGR